MSLFDALRYRLRTLRGAHDRELDEEVAHHLELGAMDARAASEGPISDEDARRRARREFGNTTYANEERRTIAGLALFDAARQDVRFITRLLRRRAAFAAVTVATIALGIGAATSIYSVADAVLFRALPFPHAERLIVAWLERPSWKANPGLIKRWDRGTLSYPLYKAWRATQTSFDEVAVWETSSAIAGNPNAADEVTVGTASASLLPVLGIHVERGSWFTAADEAMSAAPVAVISHETWAARFGSDPNIVGRVVPLNGVPHTIVGVMPRGFDLDRSGIIVAYWIAAGRDSGDAAGRTSFAFRAIGRLKPSVSLAAASAESGRAFRTALANDDDRVKGAALATLHGDQTRIIRRPLLILLAAAALLLLIACINVATLLMGEAASREHELRTRSALGASRPRLLRQLLTESVLLAGVGAAAGSALAYFGTKVIVRSAPPTIPGLGDVRVDLRVLAVALIAAVATGVLFGLAPALSLTRSSQALGVATGKSSVGGRGRAQRSLVASEVALSIVLLVGAGLLVRSFDKLSSIGFRASDLLAVSMRLRTSPFSDSVHTRALYADLVHRLRAVPGVEAVAVTSLPPFFTGSSSTSFEVEGRPTSHDSPALIVQRRSTSPEFFATAGVPIVEGRAYSEADRGNTPPVVVVSRTLAQREWPGESAVGKRIKIAGAWRTIVGIASDIETERPSADPPETFYAPLEQLMPRATPTLLVRTRGEVADAATTIRRVVHDADADISVSRVDRMDDLVAASLADDRLRTQLISLFAAIAALLAAVGTYGVAATSAARRTREMAIRVAVGASAGSIARLIVGTAAKGVAMGAAAGLALSLVGVRVLSPFLYGVRTTDPAVYAAVGLLLALTTLGATWIPARRASRVRLVDTLAADS